MTNTILVLGATGNVGSQVVKELVEAGANVRAAVRSPQKAAALKSDKVSLTEFDTEKPETFDTAFADVDKVFLITTLIPNLVEVQTNLVAAAKKAGVKHIVKLSGMGAEIEPGVTMTRWHRAVEKAIEASGMSYTFVRPNGFMQNYSNFSGQTIKAQNAFYLPMGDGKVSHIDGEHPIFAKIHVVYKLQSTHLNQDDDPRRKTTVRSSNSRDCFNPL